MSRRVGRRLFVSIALAAGVTVVAAPAAQPALAAIPTTPFISEFHYDDSTVAGDVNEFVEVQLPPGTTTNGWSIVLYNGGGSPTGLSYDTDLLPNATAGATPTVVVLDYATNGIQNGSPDGIALVNDLGAVVEFISYEGAMTASNGPAAGMTSTDVGVAESNATPPGGSLSRRLNAAGTDYVWEVTAVHTKGAVNAQMQDAAPTVTSTSPSASATGVAVDANITITFSEPVNVTEPWFTISCSSSGAHPAAVTGGPTVFNLDPTTDFVGNETCTVTIAAANVKDQDAQDPPDTMASDHSFTFQTGALPVTKIHVIQGDAAASPIVGQTVAVEAVVTSTFTTLDVISGFFLQEEDADADTGPSAATTSEGVFVTCGTTCATVVAVGDLVRVTGQVGESFNKTRIATNIPGGSITTLGTAPLPTPATITLPATGSTRDVATFENVEGMRITIPTQLMVTEFFELARFGHIVLTSGTRPYTYTHVDPTPTVAEFNAFVAELNTRRIFLDDDNNDQNDPVTGPQSDEPYPYPSPGLSITNRMRAGDTITNLTGVMDWDFAGAGASAWRIRPVQAPGVSYTFTSANPAPAAPPAVGGRLRISAFNVLNYFTTIDTTASNNTGPCGPAGTADCRGADSAAELDRQRLKMIESMLAMDADVAGLMEIQNDAGASTQDIVNALNARTAPGTYASIDTGFIGTDAIKVAIIYQPAMVTPVGAHKILSSAIDPDFDDTRSRPVLIQTFSENSTGEKFTVAVNHLKSKGSACGAGDPDTGNGAGNCNLTRTRAAEALARYLATDPTGSGDPDFLIIGDLNAYRFEDPINSLKAAGYTDLIQQFLGDSAYSYLFDGQVGYLDHALATASMVGQVTGVGEWHVNADEVPLFDYNDTVADAGEAAFERESTALPLYQPDARRSSDHDPLVVGLSLASAPGAPTAVTAVAGNAQATVSWTPPASNGASPITGYTVTSSPGGVTCTTATTSCTLTGLSNGTAYTFTVVATNVQGNSSPSAPSNAVTPVAPTGAPGAPTNVIASAGIGAVTVSWTAPTSNGGSQITSYRVTASPGGASCTTTGTSCTVTGLVPGTSYTFTVVATNAAGGGGPSQASMPVVVFGPGFSPLDPSRLFDTRPNEPQGSVAVVKQRYGQGNVLRVKVTGASGIPERGVEAVVLNVTVVDPLADGFVTVYPCGTLPLAANLNYVEGEIVPNLVIAPVSAEGEVCFYSLRDTHLVADVSGWLGSASAYKALTPARLADTRPTEPQGAVPVNQKKYGLEGDILRIKVTGAGGVPASGVGAVSLNVTAVDPDGPGFITVFPCGVRFTSASLNYVRGEIVPNAVLAPVSADGEVCFYSYAKTHIVVDVNGWFVENSSFQPVNPQRAVDTRPEYPQGTVQVIKQKYGKEGNILRVRLTDTAGVPAGNVAAVSLNVTVVDPIGPGFLTAYPCGDTRPLAANLNYVANEIIPNAVIAPVSDAGEVCFFSLQDTHIVVDINGWFTKS